MRAAASLLTRARTVRVARSDAVAAPHATHVSGEGAHRLRRVGLVALVGALVALAACPGTKAAVTATPAAATPGPDGADAGVHLSADTALAIAEAAKQPDPRVLDDDRRCKSDAECTLTTADCCGCNALGGQVGVRKDHAAALKARREPVCSAILCSLGMSDDVTCTARRAVCREGVCIPDVPVKRHGHTSTPPTKVEPIR